MNSAKRLLNGMDVSSLRGYQANSTPVDAQSWSQTVFLDQWSMSSHRIDELEELQCNWIGVLGLDWELDPSSCSRGTAESEEEKPRNLMLHQLIASTHSLRYESIVIDQTQTYWVHTVCLRVVGLGRVRLVFCFDNPERIGECIVLATDRLDWSPRNVLTQWLQALPLESFDHQVVNRSTHLYSVPPNFTSYSAALTPAL